MKGGARTPRASVISLLCRLLCASDFYESVQPTRERARQQAAKQEEEDSACATEPCEGCTCGERRIEPQDTLPLLCHACRRTLSECAPGVALPERTRRRAWEAQGRASQLAQIKDFLLEGEGES